MSGEGRPGNASLAWQLALVAVGRFELAGLLTSSLQKKPNDGSIVNSRGTLISSSTILQKSPEARGCQETGS